MPHTATNNGNGHNGASQLREKINFATNVPQRLTLEFDPPEEPRAGRFGDQYMYFFGGSKIAWFDPPVHAQIVASGAHAGEEIEITKRETKKGNRKHVTWEVVLIAPEPEEFAGPHTSYDPDYAPHAQPPARNTPPTQPAPVASPAAAAAAPPQPQANPLAQALILAIDAVEIASQHGRQAHDWDEGLALSEDAIVRLAITAYIQSQGGKQARP